MRLSASWNVPPEPLKCINHGIVIPFVVIVFVPDVATNVIFPAYVHVPPLGAEKFQCRFIGEVPANVIAHTNGFQIVRSEHVRVADIVTV